MKKGKSGLGKEKKKKDGAGYGQRLWPRMIGRELIRVSGKQDENNKLPGEKTN